MPLPQVQTPQQRVHRPTDLPALLSNLGDAAHNNVTNVAHVPVCKVVWRRRRWWYWWWWWWWFVVVVVVVCVVVFVVVVVVVVVVVFVVVVVVVGCYGRVEGRAH